jgi:hypothetical protein
MSDIRKQLVGLRNDKINLLHDAAQALVEARDIPMADNPKGQEKQMAAMWEMEQHVIQVFLLVAAVEKAIATLSDTPDVKSLIA